MRILLCFNNLFECHVAVFTQVNAVINQISQLVMILGKVFICLAPLGFVSLIGQILALCLTIVNKIIEEKKEKILQKRLVFLFGCAILCTWRHVREGRAGVYKVLTWA